MKASFLPEIINDYRVYKKGKFIGTSGEVELPELSAINETNEGAGVLGEIETPATGQFESMVTKIKFAILHENIFDLMDTTKAQELTLRADGQYTDKTTGDTEDVLVKIIVRGKAKTTNLGTLAKGKKGEPELELETFYLKIEIDNTTLLELDKYNYIYKVNGKDLMAKIRKNLMG